METEFDQAMQEGWKSNEHHADCCKCVQCGPMPSLDPVTHEVRPWSGPTWRPTGEKLGSKPGTYCAYEGSHLLVSGVCANCGLTTNDDDEVSN